MSGFALSRFTPGLMSPDDLEAIFVQESRKRLLERLVEDTREGVLTEAKHHSLIIGPRGMGKSHLVAMLRNRLAAMQDLQSKLAVAWLQEEEWGISGFADLLLRVARALAREEGRDAPEPGILSHPDRSGDAREALEALVGDRTLLVLMENLDDLFGSLGPPGQRQLRSYLQERAPWTIVATSPSLFNGVSLRTSPFYGFFSVHNLEELTPGECDDLMERLLDAWGASEHPSRARQFERRARTMAMHALAGGNPRVFVILAQLVASGSIDDVTEQIVRTIDDLTPYYQARLLLLSPQQRQVVNRLCQVNEAPPVKEIARSCGITQQSAAGQLRKLTELGYVRADRQGRNVYYQMREPILRLSQQLKGERGDPARVAAGLLVHIYSASEIRDWPVEAAGEGSLVRRALVEAGAMLADREASFDRFMVALAPDAFEALRGDVAELPDGDTPECSEGLSQLAGQWGIESSDDWGWLAVLLQRGDKQALSRDAAARALELDPHNGWARFARGMHHADGKAWEDAVADLAASRAALGEELSEGIRMAEGICLIKLGRWSDFLEVVEPIVDAERARTVRPNVARALIELGRWEEGLAALRPVAHLEPGAPKPALSSFAVILAAVRTTDPTRWQERLGTIASIVFPLEGDIGVNADLLSASVEAGLRWPSHPPKAWEETCAAMLVHAPTATISARDCAAVFTYAATEEVEALAPLRIELRALAAIFVAGRRDALDRVPPFVEDWARGLREMMSSAGIAIPEWN